MFLARHRLIPLLLLPLLAACTTQATAPIVTRDAGGDTKVAAMPAAPPVAGTPPSALGLNVSARCQFKDETGYRGRMDLEIVDADVKRFKAEVTIPRRGVCRFDLARFRQTKTLPSPVLTARNSSCRVLVWEQEKQVTVAFVGCEAQCTSGAFSYLWPILVDSQRGECA